MVSANKLLYYASFCRSSFSCHSASSNYEQPYLLPSISIIEMCREKIEDVLKMISEDVMCDPAS